MRAITLWQPWATQIFDRYDPKTIENRSVLLPPKELIEQPRPFFAIHAGLKYDDAPSSIAKGNAEPGRWPFPKGAIIPTPAQCPQGAVIGVVRLSCAWDSRTSKIVEPHSSEWKELDVISKHGLAASLKRDRWWLGPIGWRLIDAIPITPIKCRGALGCWTLPDAVAVLTARRAKKHVDAELEARAYEGAPNNPSHHGDTLPRMRVIDLVRASKDLARTAVLGVSGDVLAIDDVEELCPE